MKGVPQFCFSSCQELLIGNLNITDHKSTLVENVQYLLITTQTWNRNNEFLEQKDNVYICT